MNKLIGLGLFMLTISQVNGQDWETPIIEGYGKILNIKDSAVQPDSNLTYNLVFDIKDGKEMEGVNAGLWKIARTLNMLGASKIDPKNIHIVAAIHGEATFVVLNNERYTEENGKLNPNLELLKLLTEHDVELYVCGQASAARNIGAADMNPYVQTALSAISVLANYQLKGYALMP